MCPKGVYLGVCSSKVPEKLSISAFSVAGKGAMAEVSTIVSVVKQYLPKPDE